jgi:hypothetical protein
MLTSEINKGISISQHHCDKNMSHVIQKALRLYRRAFRYECDKNIDCNIKKQSDYIQKHLT